MCEWGTFEEVEVTVPADLSHTGISFRKVCKIDKCISDIVRALSQAGILMRASCCGHGKHNGSIILQDGRELVITYWKNKKSLGVVAEEATHQP